MTIQPDRPLRDVLRAAEDYEAQDQVKAVDLSTPAILDPGRKPSRYTDPLPAADYACVGRPILPGDPEWRVPTLTPARGREANAANTHTIIDQLTKSTNACEAYAIVRIDNTIARLENLKSMIKTKSEVNRNNAVEFVRMIDDSMREAGVLADKVEKIEKNILP